MGIISSWPEALRSRESEVQAQVSLLLVESTFVHVPEWPQLRHTHWKLSVPCHGMDTSPSAELMKWFPEAPLSVLKVQEHLQMRSRVQILIIV